MFAIRSFGEPSFAENDILLTCLSQSSITVMVSRAIDVTWITSGRQLCLNFRLDYITDSEARPGEMCNLFDSFLK